VEANWLDLVLQQQRPYAERRALYAQQFQVSPEETLAGIIEGYEEVARRTENIVAGIADLGQLVPVPADVPWFPKEIPAWSVRWVLLHLIEETSRHAGHADLIREHIDGATAVSLVAAAEGWPESEWIKPWKPPD
jgi:hypothetical protein